MSTAETFETWAVVELFGHVRMAGRVTEQELFGSKLGRVDVPRPVERCGDCNGSGNVLPFESGSSRCPACDGAGSTGGGFTTVYFGAASVYRLTPTTEEVARAVAEGSQPAPVHRWELPSPRRAAAAFDDELDDERH